MQKCLTSRYEMSRAELWYAKILTFDIYKWKHAWFTISQKRRIFYEGFYALFEIKNVIDLKTSLCLKIEKKTNILWKMLIKSCTKLCATKCSK